MNSDTLRIEIVSSALGGWWAYITQTTPGDRRIIGRVFQTNPEAWKWAEATVERLRK